MCFLGDLPAVIKERIANAPAGEYFQLIEKYFLFKHV
jgi:hypothetical protein